MLYFQGKYCLQFKKSLFFNPQKIHSVLILKTPGNISFQGAMQGAINIGQALFIIMAHMNADTAAIAILK